LDWDFYLGPAPAVPFNVKRFGPSYRFFSDYAGGRITDFGIHRFDTVHQIMGEDQPLSVSATGGRFVVKGMGDVPDLMQVTWEYPSFVLSYEMCEFNDHGTGGRSTPGMQYYNAQGRENRPNGMAFYGSNGTILADRIGYEIIPEDKHAGRPDALIRQHKNAPNSTESHARHFIACIREGAEPICGPEVGHRSSLAAHLGNIALRLNRKLHWDPKHEDFKNDRQASGLLGREARAPWDLISS
jgi:predicted dehydrogenase